MNYYESVVVDYLRADRALFLNTEFCIQINAGLNPDTSGPHWYCDVVACDWVRHTIFLCEISYAHSLSGLKDRLIGWNVHWTDIRKALGRDGHLPDDWPVRPWIFVPEHLVERITDILNKIESSEGGLKFHPRITTLEMVQPWLYRSWDRRVEGKKPECVPTNMRD